MIATEQIVVRFPAFARSPPFFSPFPAIHTLLGRGSQSTHRVEHAAVRCLQCSRKGSEHDSKCETEHFDWVGIRRE
jgi:hypothetical protein